MSREFNKSAFKLRVSRRAEKLIPKSERDFEDSVKQLGEQLSIYTRTRERVIELTVIIFKTNLWNRTHTSFVDFLMDRFSIQKSYAYILIKSAKIEVEKEENAAAAEQQPSPVSENKNNGHSVPSKPEQKQDSNPRNSTDENFHNSGNRNSVKPESKPPSKTEKVELDKVGTPIPIEALPYWERQQEVQDILSHISKLKSKVLKARESEDPLWMVIDNFVGERFDQVHSVISQAKPFTVCTQCMGTPSMQGEAGCQFCHSTGLISKWKWDNCTPKELKDIRMKSNIDYAKSHNLNMPVIA